MSSKNDVNATHKVCRICTTEKDIEEFYPRRRRGRVERLNECKSCANELRWVNGRIRDEEHRSVVYAQNQRSYFKHRDKALARQSNNRHAFKQQLIDTYGGCKDCGEIDICCLEFHHLDPTSKEFHVSAMMSKTQDQIDREIQKCEVLCANCHKLRHFYLLVPKEVLKSRELGEEFHGQKFKNRK